MDKAIFWKLIESTRDASQGDPFKQADLLTEALTQLPEEDIISYDAILREYMDKAYSVDLWEAAYIIGCGCSDDGFMDFRAWLIGQGKETLEEALLDPEYLVDVVEDGWETQEGNLLYVADNAYETKYNKMMPPISGDTPKLRGKSSRDEQSILARFPKLATKFWKKMSRTV